MTSLAEKLAAAKAQVEGGVSNAEDAIVAGAEGASESIGDVLEAATEEAAKLVEAGEEFVEDLEETIGSVGDFLKGRLHQVVLSSGKIVKPSKLGVYKAPEGELKEMLEYYATQGYVTKVE